MTYATLRRSSVLLLGTSIVACGDSPSMSEGSLSLSAANTLSVAVGQSSAPIQLQLTRVSTTAAVTLTAEGLPTGVTATFTPSTLTSATSTATLSLDAAGTATPGSSNIIVKATGGGLTTQTTVPVLVHPRPELSLTVDSANLSVLTNDLGIAAIRIGRSVGLTGNVQLSFSALPEGIVGSFLIRNQDGTATGGTSVGAPATATSAEVHILVAPTVTPGTYPVTITASSPGVADKVVTMNVVAVRNQGAISVGITPSPMSIVHGGSVLARITVRRTAPFAGSVSLTAPPNGGGFTFAMQRTTIPPADSTADVVILVTSAAGTATRNFTISAVGSGIAPVTGTLSVATSPVP